MSAHAATSSRGDERPPLVATLARLSGQSWLAAAIAGAFAAILFGANASGVSSDGSYLGGGLEANTIVQMAMTLGGGILVALACAQEGVRPPSIAIGAALAFFALAVLTMLSIGWSVAPSNSWLEADRTLSYAAAFAGAIALARLARDRWRSVLGGVLIATLLVSCYALSSKVIPETLDATDTFARLAVPLYYWNALGLTAALGIPAALWLGSRREGHGVLNAIAAPALTVLLITLVLSYSRGALLAAVIGGVLWFALVPLRLRALALLLAAGAPAAAALAWALRQPALVNDKVPLGDRMYSGHRLGLILIAAVAVSFAAALVIRFAAERHPLSAARRRALAVAVWIVIALVPLGGVAALAHSSRGFFGEISHGWHQLTTPSAPQPGNTAARLTQTGSEQALYWHYAIEVFNTNPALGVGAGAFPVADQRFMTSTLLAENAHGYVFQTLADLGIVGLLLSLALALTWCVAAARAARPFRPRAPGAQHAERIGLATMIAVVVVFAVHSTFDWTWFVPGDAIVALLCAGWVAGRSRRDERPSGSSPSLQRLGRSPAAAAAAAAAIALALIVAWSQWQPLRSEQAATAGDIALGNGHLALAVADERTALARDPLDLTPRTYLGDAYAQQGRYRLAQRTFEEGIAQQPSNYNSWLALWQFDDSPYTPYLPASYVAAGERALAEAIFLNPRNKAIPSYLKYYLATLK